MKCRWIYEEAIEEYNKRIEDTKALQNELKKIKFVTEANGEPFKIIERNIAGVKVVHNTNMPNKCKSIALVGYINGRYVSDYIPLYKATPEYTYEPMTVEEVKEQIKELDESYTNRIAETKRDIAILEPIFNLCDEFTGMFKNKSYSMKAIIKKYIERSL